MLRQKLIVPMIAAIAVTELLAQAPQRNQRVEICHVPRGNPDDAKTIVVAMQAVQAHLRHGDYRGPCEEIRLPD